MTQQAKIWPPKIIDAHKNLYYKHNWHKSCPNFDLQHSAHVSSLITSHVNVVH